MEGNSETTQTGETQEYVDIPDASDADLDAFLANAGKDEQVEEVKAEPTVEPEEREKPEEQKEPAKEVAPVSRDEFAKLQKQIQGQELLIKRRTSEIGELKRQLLALKAEREQSVEDQWAIDPKKAYQTQRELERVDEALNKLSAEEETLTNVSQAQQLLTAHVGEALDFAAMAEALESDGMPPEYMQVFRANPYAAALPETLIQLAKRGAAEKKVKELEAALYQIVPKFQELLEAQKKAPQDVAKNISRALHQPPPITAATGGVGQATRKPVDVSSMSDAELEEFLRNQ